MGHVQIDATREKKSHHTLYNEAIKSQDVDVVELGEQCFLYPWYAASASWRSSSRRPFSSATEGSSDHEVSKQNP